MFRKQRPWYQSKSGSETFWLSDTLLAYRTLRLAYGVAHSDCLCIVPHMKTLYVPSSSGADAFTSANSRQT